MITTFTCVFRPPPTPNPLPLPSPIPAAREARHGERGPGLTGRAKFLTAVERQLVYTYQEKCDACAKTKPIFKKICESLAKSKDPQDKQIQCIMVKCGKAKNECHAARLFGFNIPKKDEGTPKLFYIPPISPGTAKKTEGGKKKTDREARFSENERQLAMTMWRSNIEENSMQQMVDWALDQNAKYKTGSTKTMAYVEYLDVYQFLYGSKKPKVLMLQAGPFQPSWLQSTAVKFKKGKNISVEFGYADVSPDTKGEEIANRFGIYADELPAVLTIHVVDEGEANFVVETVEEKKSANVKKFKAAAQKILDLKKDATRDGTKPVPSFPQPDRPRKQGEISLAELTPDNLDKACYKGTKSICVIVLVKAAGGEYEEKTALTTVAKTYRNDNVSFVYLDARKQADFLSAFGLAAREVYAPANEKNKGAIVLKPSKRRNRYAVYKGRADSAALSQLVDQVLGGYSVEFKTIQAFPELTPEYLQDDGEL